MWGAAERTVVGGTSVHAATAGPVGAPTVVCVHGLGCSNRYFAPFARTLAADVRVAAPDLPGFGRTPGPSRPLDVRDLSEVLAGWLRATGRSGATLVGNSAGCQVIVDMAVHSPDVLGPAVLSGPTMDRRARSAPRQAVRLLRDVPRERPSLPLVLATDYRRAGARRIAATLGHLLRDRIEDKVHHVRTPTVVVRGGRDPIAPRGWATELARLLPDGRLAEVPDVGHALNFSAPEQLAAVTRQVLAG